MSDNQPPSGPEFVFRVNRAIPQLGAERGDRILYSPNDPDCRIYVIHCHKSQFGEADLLKNFDRLDAVSQMPPVSLESARDVLVRRSLRRTASGC